MLSKSNLIVFCILLVSLISCQKRSLQENAGAFFSVSQNCAVKQAIDQEAFVPFQIDSSCAVGFISAYQNYIDNVQDSLENNFNADYPDSGKKLIYGARVARSELIEILSSTSSGDEVYIMLGIIPPNDSTEIIFSIQSKGRWQFYDFTLPCPNACPEYQL